MAQRKSACSLLLWSLARLALFGAVCFAVIGGCASQNLPPALSAGTRQAPSGNASPGPAGALVIEVESVVQDRPLGATGRPLTTGARLITGPNGEPLGASDSDADLVLLLDDTAWTEVPEGSSQRKEKQPTSRRLLVPVGWEGVIDLRPAKGKVGPVRLIITPRGGDSGPDLVLQAPARLDETQGLNAIPAVQSDRVPWPLTESVGQFVLGFPDQTRDSGPAMTLWRVRVAPAPDDESTAAELAALAASAKAAPGPSRWSSLGAALDAKEPPAQRRAMQLAALQSGADVAGEASAVCGDAELSVLAGAMAHALSELGPDATTAQAGWAVDRAVLQAIAALRSENKLGRGMSAMVSARYGEVGREPAVAAEMAAASASAADFAQRLINEHLVYLDDPSPAARVRAFDWLTSCGAAPEGYDPFSPQRARRAAIDAYQEQRRAKP